jgi:prepilin-type N-terminal cleavage/methylation domain-containing protein/prepilin-type processing-associated H-X9-DG protein
MRGRSNTKSLRGFTLIELPAVRERKARGFTLIELPAVRERKARGFTLIELLVVIALILILLSILAPLISISGRKGRVALCKANLRQLYLGMIGDMHTRGSFTFREYQIGRLWMDDVSRDLSDEGKRDPVRFCPEALTPSPGGASDYRHAWTWNASSLNFGSYGLNGWIYGPSDTTGAHGGAGLYFGNENWPAGFWASLSTAGGRAPLFADSSWVDGWPFETDAVPQDLYVGMLSGQKGTYLSRFCVARHDIGKLGINVAFCDGHIQYVPLDMLWDLQWSRTFVRQGKKSPFP